MRWGIAAAALGCSMTHALAQSAAPAPSQVGPPVIAAPAIAPRISLPQVPAGAATPHQAKTLFFTLTGFDLEGEFPELVTIRTQLAAALIGKRISVADLFGFAEKLQQAYINAGYPLARIVTLPQEIGKQARVKLRVIDGFVERMDLEALPPTARDRVRALLAPLLRKPHLTQQDLERQLLLAGDTPGLVLNATFGAGKEIGGSLLILTGRYRPISATLYIDNALPQSFRSWQAVTSFSFNNLLGQGEQVSVSAAGYPNEDYFTAHPTRRYLSTTLAFPIGIDGLKAELGATNARTTPHVEPILATQGLLDRAYAKLAFDAVKRRDTLLAFSARFDATDERIDTLALNPALPISLDRTRVLRGGFEGLWRWREAGLTFTYGGNISQGLDAFGARTADRANALLPLSRFGADAVFTKLDGHAEVLHSLPEDFFWSLAISGQTGFNKPMLTSEQFDITGARALSGFTSGALPGDRAWVVRGEFGRAFAPFNALVVTPYIFSAFGERTLENPTILEFRRLVAKNYGVGARFNVAAFNEFLPEAYGFLEWSRREVEINPRLNGDRIFAGMVLRY
jgi:hemolysin activation/secretion protein